MTTVERPTEIAPPPTMSVADYLAAELVSPIKHEYVGGAVYMMVGAKNVHNIVATNTLVALASRHRGKPCRPFNSNTKVHIVLPDEIRFYYPDVAGVCRQNPETVWFKDEPSLGAVVLS